MTHAETVLRAVSDLLTRKGDEEFSRNEVRIQIGIGQEEWMDHYTAIFQAMREDQPGGAPLIGIKYCGVFKRIERGKYMLTEYGKSLVKELRD